MKRISAPFFRFCGFSLLVAALILLPLGGCNCDDDPVTPPATTGDVLVSVVPDTLAAGWSLQGPEEYSAQGLGSLALNRLQPGTYTLTWGTLENWVQPDPAQVALVLEAGEQITFTGQYGAQPASLQISHDPAWQGIDWELAGPDGFSLAGQDEELVTDLAPGQYTLAWTDSELCSAPADTTFSLAPGESGAMVGHFDCGYTAFSPDVLMANLGQIYENMDAGSLDGLLAEDFQFIILPSTMTEWLNGGNPLSANTFDGADFGVIHGHIFGGSTGLDAVGNQVAPIGSLEVVILEKAAPWQMVPTDHEYFGGQGAYWAPYYILLYFNSADLFRFSVQQTVEFYVVPREVDGLPVMNLLGVLGHEPTAAQDKVSESVTWCRVLALFR